MAKDGNNYDYHTIVNKTPIDPNLLQSNNLLNSYIIGRSDLFGIEYGDGSVYSKLALDYDLQKGTIFAVSSRRNKYDETVVVGGMAAIISNNNAHHRLPAFNKYAEKYTSIDLIEKKSADKSVAEIYGVWRDPDHGGKGISEKLYASIYKSLKDEGVDYILATLTPKNIEPYLRQASVNSELYKPLILRTDITVPNTVGHMKPRLAVVAFEKEDELYQGLLNSKNAVTVEQYLKNLDIVKKRLNSENDGQKPSTAVLVDYINKLSVENKIIS